MHLQQQQQQQEKKQQQEHQQQQRLDYQHDTDWATIWEKRVSMSAILG
jgi:hypothetical protein